MRRGANAQSFVVDECNLDLAEFIRGYPVLSYRDLGLERGASDEKLVEHAGYRGVVIVSLSPCHKGRIGYPRPQMLPERRPGRHPDTRTSAVPR